MKGGNIYYPKLSYLINGILFKTHNQLGRYCREKQYGDYIEFLFKKNAIRFEREKIIDQSGNIIDFIVENVIIIELKAKTNISKIDYYQIQRYLQATNIKLGLLVNFRNTYLKPIRVIKIETINRAKFE